MRKKWLSCILFRGRGGVGWGGVDWLVVSKVGDEKFVFAKKIVGNSQYTSQKLQIKNLHYREVAFSAQPLYIHVLSSRKYIGSDKHLHTLRQQRAGYGKH
jgi:hypothetical protein